MKNIAFFGGSGGLGTKVKKNLTEFNVDTLSSKDVNLVNSSNIDDYFDNNNPDVVIIFSNYNFNSFIHKYKGKEKELYAQIDVNIKGVTEVISKSLPGMRARGFGRIIIASSITVDRKVMGTSIYAASKAYYENLVSSISLENAAKGITANCIQLGYMDGGLTYNLSDDFIQNTVNSIPCKRLGTAEEISDTIKFIINTEYLNGSTIKLAGGL